jgi:hypothetical protein
MKISKPNRATRTYIQKLVARPDRVFPLLCPVREALWIHDWDPLAVWSFSGVAETDCVFVMPGTPEQSIWYVTRHEPERGFVEMLKIVPAMTACRLTIQLAPSSTGCDATVTYSHTSLSPQGDVFVANFTEAFYEKFMREWETQINHYLVTGEALKAA